MRWAGRLREPRGVEERAEHVHKPFTKLARNFRSQSDRDGGFQVGQRSARALFLSGIYIIM